MITPIVSLSNKSRRIPTTTLDFKIIDGNKVEFELTKGNILTVADANISGLIVDGVIDFEYIVTAFKTSNQ